MSGPYDKISPCPICSMSFVPELAEDRAAHRKIHKQLAGGVLPMAVREFMKAFGYAVAHDDGGLERLKGSHKADLGKLVVAFSWWSRALQNGVDPKDFDEYMATHLAFLGLLVNDIPSPEAEKRMTRWGKYDG